MRFLFPSRFSHLLSIGLLLFTQVSLAAGVTITHTHQGKTVEVSVGDVIRIELSGTPTTGYWWHFGPLDSQCVDVVRTDIIHPPERTLEGAPVTGIWEVKAKRQGRIKIRASYSRSWDKDISPLREFWFILKIR
jgi:predicted secreted protein